MLDSPYNGSWRGIFWHRNYLGTFMALACLVFTHNFLNEPNSKIKKGFFQLLSILAIIFTILSSSATGIIALVIVSIAEIVASIWVRTYAKIKPVFYWIAGVLGIILVFVVMTNIDFLFGLLGRNASLTGRIPMWNYLMENYVNTRPWMGFGIGSFWVYETIRNGVQTAVAWGYPVMIGDNGWMDILLQLGWVGLAAFLLVLIKVAFVSVKHLLSSRSKTSTFPLLFFLFVILSNISLSLFLEVEAFIWFVMISLLFSITNITKSGDGFL
jgi:O-antigen ligase